MKTYVNNQRKNLFEEIVKSVSEVEQAGTGIHVSRKKLLAEMQVSHGLSAKKAQEYLTALIDSGRLVVEGDSVKLA